MRSVITYLIHLLPLTIICFAADISAQPANNRLLKKINSDDGLSHNIVNDIVQDGKGFIWIGSRQGVLFYNRSLNEFFHCQKSDGPHGLSGNIILDIRQDYQGNMLIGTQEGGLNILSQDQLKVNHPRTFKFSKILPGSETNNLSYRSIQSIYEVITSKFNSTI